MSNPIVKALEHAAEKLGKTLGKDAGKAVEDLYHGAGTRLKKVASNHHENDKGLSDHFNGLGKGGKSEPKGPHTSLNGGGRGAGVVGRGRAIRPWPVPARVASPRTATSGATPPVTRWTWSPAR
ncbi:hypothetical protein ACGF4C_26960 [Streptomyces sp. NPDC048197]|uniref:hypothetical protein n=1 Tax=Streptomyces sp. NPDC048197 TaxID=3365511 RepID=UPI003712E9D1